MDQQESNAAGAPAAFDAGAPANGPRAQAVSCAPRLELVALPGLPVVSAGDDLAAILREGLARAGLSLADGDVLVVTSKIVSRAEGRFVDLASVVPSDEARALGAEIGKDPSLVELVLRESAAVSRKTRGVLIVRHKLGFVCANAGIDCSNAAPAGAAPGSGPWALLLPSAPDSAAEALRAALSGGDGARDSGGDGARAPEGDAKVGAEGAGVRIGVVISDSFGRPFRFGTVGAAIGLAGLPALWDQRGEKDLFGRRLEATITALGDQVAAAADLVAGQAGEGRAAVLVRGLSFSPVPSSAAQLTRPAQEDLYA